MSGHSAGRSPSLAGGGGEDVGDRTLVSAQLAPDQQRASVAVGALALRLHSSGWEDAVQCLHTYTVLAEQAQRQYAAAAQARAASPDGARPAAPAPAPAAAPPPPPGGSMAVRLHVRCLVLEVLADAELPPLRGSMDSASWDSTLSLVPACILRAQLQLEAAAAPDCGSRVQASVPGLLVLVGAVPAALVMASPAEPLELPLSDALLGLHRLELSLVSQQQHRQLQPAATTADGKVVLGDAHQVSVGASLAHASLWAQPRNLCAAAALAGHAQALAARLAEVLPLADLEPAGPAEQVGVPLWAWPGLA